MINRDNDRKKLEICFSDGSDVSISLRLEGDKLTKYEAILPRLLSLILSSQASQDMLPSLLFEETMRKFNNSQAYEVLHKQGELLNNILKVIREFKNMPFSSKDIKNRYEERIGKPIQLSTVATYLLRLHDKGFLIRSKRGKEYIYQAATILLKNSG